MNPSPQLIPSESRFRSTDLPRRKWMGFLLRFVKTFEVLLFRVFQQLGLYRPQRSIIGLPSLATPNYTIIQAVVYNGTQEEVLGYRPRRLLHRILKGLPDVEMFEHVRFQIALSNKALRTVEGSTDTRGFLHLQFPSQLPKEPPDRAWLRMEPLGVNTLFGRVKLGDYEMHSSPVYFLSDRIRWVVVSDIDDTIKESNIAQATTWKSILSSLFLGHFYTYQPVEGMADLYKDLEKRDSLIVYLTSTPYQLAPFLLKFLKQSAFPDGPVFLRWLGYGKVRHKWRSLLKILSNLEPNQKTILIGDSGEKDLQIYRRICENPLFANQVERIFIRHIPGTPVQKPLSNKEYFYKDVEELRTQLSCILGTSYGGNTAP